MGPPSALDSWSSSRGTLTVQFELRSLQNFATTTQVRAAVAAWIEDYKTARRHSACQRMPWSAYERLLAQRGEERQA